MPRSGPGPRIGWPSMVTSPREGYSRPAISRSIVVLPQPDGPIIAVTWLAWTSKETSSRAITLPFR